MEQKSPTHKHQMTNRSARLIMPFRMNANCPQKCGETSNDEFNSQNINSSFEKRRSLAQKMLSIQYPIVN